ncbi:MAG: hypothetical protein AMJ70_07120 [Dehalococcoidia bacterium SG8_51_3]|nr:MAG: hypothetical protein AMJ70_07120 [Dehalococcoidia bacterium SG8_51_3]
MAYECILLKTALSFIDEQVTPDERKQILEILEGISNDPQVDGKTKFYFLVPPAVFTICRSGDWWIIYYRPKPSVIHIINLGRVSELPNIRRSSY